MDSRFDLHNHTKFSRDSFTDPKQLVNRALKIGLNGIAITDHNSIEGYLSLKSENRIRLICGEEIDIDNGEIIALFVNEKIKPGTLTEVLDRIKEQGAISIIPHPFDRLRKHLDPTNINDSDLKRIDGIEAYNSRIVLWKDVDKALSFAKSHNKTITAGSDSHFVSELGKGITIIPEFSDEEELRKHLLSRRTLIQGKQNSIFYHVGTKIVKMIKKLL
ncbi:PHP domain-containing protein [Candidatus Micrarchaeota archaeon]|nr:PHP domain-containing protein [Candidatus Micrarchaeota archaeon]